MSVRLEKRKVRILRIIGECKTGGTEVIALNYYRHLDHNQFAMDFLFYGKSLPRFTEELEQHGDKVFNVIEYSKGLIRSIREIRRIVKAGKYDIVHSQLNTLNVFPLLGAWLGGSKIRIAANHSTANLRYETKKSIIKYCLRPTVCLFATNLCACSKEAAIWGFGKRKFNKVKIIPNAIELTNFKYSDETRKLIRSKEKWEGKFVVGHIGRFTEQKNHRYIIKIFDEIVKKCPNGLLVFIGEGELIEPIREQVMKLKLEEKVRFLGIRFDISSLMQGMDVFLFPSLYEGLGNVIIEAQGVSLKSFVSDRVPREVKLTEFVNFLSLEDAPEKWADEIVSYLIGYQRTDTHPELMKANYDIETAVKGLEDYYLSLLTSRAM